MVFRAAGTIAATALLLSGAMLSLLPDSATAQLPVYQCRDSRSSRQPVQTTRFRTRGGLSQSSADLIHIQGEVVVQQGTRIIENDQSTRIHRGDHTVQMDGNVVLRDADLLLLGASALIDSERQSHQVETARYTLYDYAVRGSADRIVYSSDSGLITINHGEFSRCEPNHPFWTLRADQLVLDRERSRGYARKASIRLGKLPVLYYPFTLPFPLGDARVSGFLPPSAGSTRSGGFDLEVPYYLNLAPHYDATLSPRLVSDRGVMLGAELRYLAGWSMNSLTVTHLAGDRQFEPTIRDSFGSGTPPVADRWFVGVQHQGAIGRHITTFVDYTEVSDQDYFLDLGGAGLEVVSRSHLNQQGRIHFDSRVLRAALNVQRIQVIDPLVNASNVNQPFDRLPQLRFDTATELPLGFRLALHGEVTSFDRQLRAELLSPAQLEGGALVTGERIRLQPGLAWSVESPGWFLRTGASYRYIAYDLQNQAVGTAAEPTTRVGGYSVDGGLIFERHRRNGHRQTLEPRLFYLYRGFQEQSRLPLFDTAELNFSFAQLFREDRFSGGDRVTDANQLAMALTSRLLGADGSEQGRFSIGQIRYFRERRVSLANPLQNWLPRYSLRSPRSAIAGTASLMLHRNWQLHTDVQWDEERGEVIEGNLQVRYHRDNNHLFNFSYRYRSLVNSPLFVSPASIDSRIRQTDVSAVWPVGANWKLLGRWHRDHSNRRNLDSFAGIEWSNCCATVRVVGREWVDDAALFVPGIEPNRGVFLQITLHGLGDLTGGGLSRLLQDGILGFKDDMATQTR